MSLSGTKLHHRVTIGKILRVTYIPEYRRSLSARRLMVRTQAVHLTVDVINVISYGYTVVETLKDRWRDLDKPLLRF